MHCFLKFIFGIKLYMFRRVSLSIIRSFSLLTQQWYMSYRFADSLRAASYQQTCMTYTIAVCIVKKWWWTEELSEIFISVINQLDAQNLFYNKFISCLYMFRALSVHRQEVKIVFYSLWYHHTYRCDDTGGCIILFWPPDDEHMMVEICRGMK